MKAGSQNDQIKLHLLSGNPITPMEALNLYGCFRVSARIYDLRADGMQIEKRNKTVNGKTFAEYFIKPENL